MRFFSISHLTNTTIDLSNVTAQFYFTAKIKTRGPFAKNNVLLIYHK